MLNVALKQLAYYYSWKSKYPSNTLAKYMALVATLTFTYITSPVFQSFRNEYLFEKEKKKCQNRTGWTESKQFLSALACLF